MTRRHWFALGLFALLALVSPAGSAEDDAVKDELGVLKNANVDSDSKALIAYLQKRTTSEELRAKIAEAIRNLSADEYNDREKASKTLIDIGAPARAQLREALKDSELETRRRAKRALDKIGPPSIEAMVYPAVARVLATRKAPDAAKVILKFLPSIEEADTAAEVARSLSRVALDRSKKPDPAILEALSDKYPIRRWAAASALAYAAGKDQRDAVVKLLDDTDIGVRYRVAEALTLGAKDTGGISALIKLVDKTSHEESSLAEDLLVDLAGEKAPVSPSDRDSPRAMERYRKEWEDWWGDNKKIDLSKIEFDATGRNYTLVGIYQSVNRGNGKLIELDDKHKEKWAIDNLSYPVHACKTSRHRVVVCEYNGNRVTERDTKGKILWTKQVTYPLSCQRLPSGNILIVNQTQILEVDRHGKDVQTVHNRANLNMVIVTAGRHKDGTYTVVHNTGSVTRLDKSGKSTTTYSFGSYLSYNIGVCCNYLPNGGIIIPDYNGQKLREFDSAGKSVKEFAASYPLSVTRLSNGNHLYLNRQQQYLVELSKEGRGTTIQIPGVTINGVRRNNVLFAERK